MLANMQGNTGNTAVTFDKRRWRSLPQQRPPQLLSNANSKRQVGACCEISGQVDTWALEIDQPLGADFETTKEGASLRTLLVATTSPVERHPGGTQGEHPQAERHRWLGDGANMDCCVYLVFVCVRGQRQLRAVRVAHGSHVAKVLISSISAVVKTEADESVDIVGEKCTVSEI
jgi:hypothetical protein